MTAAKDHYILSMTFYWKEYLRLSLKPQQKLCYANFLKNTPLQYHISDWISDMHSHGTWYNSKLQVVTANSKQKYHQRSVLITTVGEDHTWWKLVREKFVTIVCSAPVALLQGKDLLSPQAVCRRMTLTYVRCLVTDADKLPVLQTKHSRTYNQLQSLYQLSSTWRLWQVNAAESLEKRTKDARHEQL